MKQENSTKNKGEILAKVMNLADIVQYQGKAVVSRQLLKKETGNISLFAFDKGEGLSEHVAPFDAFVYILDGEVEIIISQKSHNLKQGEMIIMPANKPHALKAHKQFKMLLVMLKK